MIEEEEKKLKEAKLANVLRKMERNIAIANNMRWWYKSPCKVFGADSDLLLGFIFVFFIFRLKLYYLSQDFWVKYKFEKIIILSI